MNFKQELLTRQNYVQDLLQAQFDAKAFPETIYESVRYSLLAKSKRIRPILVMEGAKCVGGSAQAVEPLMCAIEMIHTYSLIHDDLPAMDDDDLRRGVPTNHVVYGEAMAILAGDALLNWAFEKALAGALQARDPKAWIKAIAALANAAGMQGMIGGQVVDILSEGKAPDEETLSYIHSHKTGALLKAAVTIGAIACGATKEELASLERYGDAIGLMFQIVDDILDEVGDSAALGKNVGMDKEHGKMTYPYVYGMEASYKKVRELYDEALTSLEPFGQKGEFLRALADYLVSRTN